MAIIVLNPWLLRSVTSIFTLALLLATWRLVRGPSLFDRIISIDLISAIIMCSAAVFAIETGNSVYLEISTVIAIISFLGTVAFARYLEVENSN
jgi:multicomponent Na+:H+ antiporter subunit F